MENKVRQPTNQTTQMGRTVFETPDGQLVSELSKTVIINGAYVNVPSIIDGVEFDEDELVEKLITGEISPTSRHNTLEEAEQAAIQRSNNLRIIDAEGFATKPRPVYEKKGQRPYSEKSITFGEYLEKVNQRALQTFHANQVVKVSNPAGDDE